MPEAIQNYLSNLPTEKIPNGLVILLGIGVVFIGLFCIVILVKAIGLFFKGKTAEETVEVPAPVASVVEQPIQNRQEIIAAVSAVIAEELGTDISAIRIHSFKKI